MARPCAFPGTFTSKYISHQQCWRCGDDNEAVTAACRRLVLGVIQIRPSQMVAPASYFYQLLIADNCLCPVLLPVVLCASNI